MNRTRKHLVLALGVLTFALFISCGEDARHSRPVTWQFRLNDSTAFNLNGWFSDATIVIQNDSEEIIGVHTNDSTFHLPTFNGIISGHWVEDTFQGVWTDQLRDNYRIDLLAFASAPQEAHQPGSITHWDFYLPADDTIPMGTLLLSQHGSRLRGTVATETGDLRYLSGNIETDNTWAFGTFDGAHLYKFECTPSLGRLDGFFYSGNHYSSTFRAIQLDSLVTLTSQSAPVLPGVAFEFSHWSVEGDSVRWTLDDLTHEVMVIDIMGTWCPNCLDEITALKTLQKEFPDVGFLSVAFERRADIDPDAAWVRIQQYQEALGIPWNIVLGGPASKAMATTAFPFLEKVASFPTTLFINRKGQLLTHSGFNGPATGEAYDLELSVFRNHINNLKTSN